MNVRILYVLDSNGPGTGGPFPQMTVFGENTPDEVIWTKFLDRLEETGELLEDIEGTEEEIREELLGGFDVQGDMTYWNLVTEEVEGT